MDQIIKSYLEDFRTSQGFADQISESKLFEHFVNYCVISRIDPEKAEMERINVGGQRNPGVDGIAILANEKVVFDSEEIDSIYGFMGYLNVEFIFTQAKTSPKFEMGDVAKFTHSVKEFFATSTQLSYEEDMLRCKKLKDYIYKNSMRLNGKPAVRMYYASLGSWKHDPNIASVAMRTEQELMNLAIFDSAKFTALDADKLTGIYRELKNKITREVNFEKHTILPKISNIIESYVGILQATELLRLITHQNDEGLNKQLFNDNIRDFQGFNSVNNDIKETIIDEQVRDKFALFNNGVTVVAKSINKVGTAFKINDFQIVNGCQTCHVLYYLREKLRPTEVFVPFKLIVTEDIDVANRIVKATNRQTEVKSEAFEALSPFHRKLEEYYLSFKSDANKRLFYERRAKQYENSSVNQSQVVSLSAQTTSFLSMFLNEPHSTPRYYGEILRSYKTKIFQETHNPVAYYTAGLAITKAESFMRHGSIASKYRRFKYHLILLFRILIGGANYPPIANRAIEAYCNALLSALWREDECLKTFLKACETIDAAIKNFSGPADIAHRVRGFTEILAPGLLEGKRRGRLTYYNKSAGYGFISSEDADYFVHVTDFQRSSIEPDQGKSYMFDAIETDRGPKAVNIEPS